MQCVLEIDSVIKSFNGKQILTDIYLKCETGNIIGMLGRNASGKSTLLKILFGILPAESKFVRIDGKLYDKAFKSENEICFLPQESFLPRSMKVSKVLDLYLQKSAINSFLDDSILFPLKENKISSLSGGELRFLEIKLLLYTECKFLLLDEPFSGISPIIVDSIKELIKAKSKSKGIILTDHDYRNVLDVANRYCLIFDGGIKEITNKEELVKWGYISESKLNK